MIANYQNILHAAKSSLTAQERLRLAQAMWEDVSPEDWTAPSPEWIAEVQSRSAAYDAGEITASSWPEVRSRARGKAGLDG